LAWLLTGAEMEKFRFPKTSDAEVYREMLREKVPKSATKNLPPDDVRITFTTSKKFRLRLQVMAHREDKRLIDEGERIYKNTSVSDILNHILRDYFRRNPFEELSWQEAFNELKELRRRFMEKRKAKKK
jgi:hypothetical protein